MFNSPLQLFTLQAANTQALAQQIAHFLSDIGNAANKLLETQVFTNSDKSQRLALTYSNTKELQEKLLRAQQVVRENNSTQLPEAEGIYFSSFEHTGKTLWLFPGFGSEFPHMLTGLVEHFPSVQKWLNLMESLLEPTAKREAGMQQEHWIEQHLQQKRYGLHEIGPFGSISSLAIQEILIQLGVPCNAMLGHSNGENSSLIASGTLGYESDEQLLQIIAAATSLQKPEGEEGQYLVVSHISPETIIEIQQQFDRKVWLAMKNCPGQTVFYLSQKHKDEVLAYLKAKRLIAFDLFTDHPYHTSLFNQRGQSLHGVYNTFSIQTSRIPVYSCVNGAAFPQEPHLIKERALQQWVKPVLFQETLEACHCKGFDTFIEIGPGNRLQGFVKDSLRGRKHKTYTCSQKSDSAWNGLLKLVAQLWANHIPVHIEAFAKHKKSAPKRSPVKQFGTAKKALFQSHQELMQQFLKSHQRITDTYMASMKHQASEPVSSQVATQGPLLNGSVTRIKDGIEIHTQLHIKEYPLVMDHAMGGKLPVIPFTLSMEVIAEAAALLLGQYHQKLELKEVKGNAWLVFDSDQLSLRITAKRQGNDIQVQVFNSSESSTPQAPAFEGRVSALTARGLRLEPIAGLNQHSPGISISDFYEKHLFHGPCFQAIHKVDFWNEAGVQARFQMPQVAMGLPKGNTQAFTIPGAMLDSCGQLMAYWLHEMGLSNYAIFPFSARRFEQYQAFPKAGEYVVCTARIQQRLGMVSGDFEFVHSNGRLLGKLTDFQLKMYQNDWIPLLLMSRIKGHDISHLDVQFLEEGAGIWKKVWARTVMRTSDYTKWLQLSAEQQLNRLYELHGQPIPVLEL